jgi:hypothetical protein
MFPLIFKSNLLKFNDSSAAIPFVLFEDISTITPGFNSLTANSFLA